MKMLDRFVEVRGVAWLAGQLEEAEVSVGVDGGIVQDVHRPDYLFLHLLVHSPHYYLYLHCSGAQSHLVVLPPPLQQQKRGKPRSQVPADIAAAFDEAMSSKVGVTLEQLYSKQPSKVFWRFRCSPGKQHLLYCTADAIFKRWRSQPDSFPPQCMICSSSRKANQPISTHEEAAREAAAALQLACPGVQFTVEVRVLSEKKQLRFAAADLLLFKQQAGERGSRVAMLAIMVDGEQHTSQPFEGSSLEKQLVRDERFDIAALGQNWQVLRLHHADYGQFSQLMGLAFKEASASARPFVMYSKSYPRCPPEEHYHIRYTQ